ncbi:hypothetical protein [Sphingomonas sp. PP-F2F-A104-K0414]|uniref:hypothetical protein n=1 Tax=Sphingomonas sp. PP-F2F-A104-K0414 TaxID=2135661 RepID=UPI00104A8D8C|nr:hypothetical protein [Sphingomonas sp. PP-F2F-A104-K0414]
MGISLLPPLIYPLHLHVDQTHPGIDDITIPLRRRSVEETTVGSALHMEGLPIDYRGGCLQHQREKHHDITSNM